jgi:hypothetical protein
VAFLLIAGLILAVVVAAVTRRKPTDRTASDLARLIDRFVGGTCGPYDWDDFVCGGRLANADLERVRRQCASLPDRHPPDQQGHYCNARGIEELRQMANKLREGADAA